MIDDDFLWLQEWFAKHCNGDWEHDQIIAIRTFDNPGWGITISLFDTELENKEFIEIKKDITPDDWLSCYVEKGKFQGAGGPKNLPEILKIFRHWALEK